MKKNILLIVIVLGLLALLFVYRGVLIGEETEQDAACFVFDEEKASITEYKMFCGDKVVIPAMIDDMEVLAIGNYAFRNTEVKSVSIPETVTEIGIGAFMNIGITEVTLREGLEVIKPYAFYGNALTKLEIPSTVTRIGIAAFNKNELRDADAFIYFRDDSANVNDTILIGYGGSEKEVVIPDQVVIIYLNAFEDLGLTSVTFSDNTERIEFSAFANNQ